MTDGIIFASCYGKDVSGKWLCNGTLNKGWVEKDGEKYYYDNYGNATKGWKTINDKKYYFDKKGQMLYDCEEYAGYKFDKNGVATPIEEEEEDNDVQVASESSSSRSTSSGSSYSSNVGNADGSIYSAAMSQIGVNQDCTALVSNSLAAAGIYFHGWPSDYLSLGPSVSYSQAQPGDVLVYNGHVAIYAGNGMAVHGGFNGNQTVLYSANCSSGAFTVVRPQ